MNFNEYQEKASQTAIYPIDTELIDTNHTPTYYNALWAGENIGEICNKLKKVIRDDDGIVTEDKEIEIERWSSIGIQSLHWLANSIKNPDVTGGENLNLNKLGLVYTTLGLIGEVGELCGKVKKLMETTAEINEEQLEILNGEIGDILWYIGNITKELKIDLDKCAQKNIDKLNSRKERGVLQGSGDNR